MRKRLFLFLTVSLALLFAALLGEVALRVMNVRLAGSTYTLDRELGWGLRAGATAWHTGEGEAWTQINRFGFRDKDRTLEKAPGVYRIAVLGDSYTEARGVDLDKTFTALAEQQLRGCAAFEAGAENDAEAGVENDVEGGVENGVEGAVEVGGVEVLNFGVSGYGTGQELLTLQQRVWQFDPDLIVVQFFAGNDLFNNYRKLNVSDSEITPYFLLDGDGLRLDDSFRLLPRYQPFRFHLKRTLATVLNSSRLLLLAYQARLKLAEMGQTHELAARAAAPGGPPQRYQAFWFYQPPEHPWMREAWEITERLLARMHREARQRNRAFWVMLTPTPEQILPTERERGDFAQRYQVEDLDYADKRVLELAGREGFRCLNTTLELRNQAESRKEYLTGFANTRLGTGHFNETGHQAVARMLSREICGAAMEGSLSPAR
jgi:lysophospholipase L1-like esterase